MASNIIEPLVDGGHALWMDKYFNSPNVAHFLKTKGTNYVGTLRMNRKMSLLLSKQK
jgi:hypothetical protein